MILIQVRLVKSGVHLLSLLFRIGKGPLGVEHALKTGKLCMKRCQGNVMALPFPLKRYAKSLRTRPRIARST